MKTKSDQVFEIFRIALMTLGWYILGLSAVAFSLSRFFEAIIDLVLLGIIIYILIDRRLLPKLEGRSISGVFLLAFYLVFGLILDIVIRDLRVTDIQILGTLYIPGVIIIIRSIGLIMFAAILFWKSITLTRQYFVSKG